MSTTHDLIVIGGGSAGLVGARFAARLGARVALVEKNRIGGDCTWTGCVPSKALIRCARSAREVRGAARFGITAGAPVVDMAKVRQHVRSAIQQVYEEERPEVLAAEGIDVVLAPARFEDAQTVQAGDRRLTAPKVVIATGASPFIPPIPGLADVEYHTHESIFDNERLPHRLIVVGAGPIGLEMAFAYAGLGAEVNVVGRELLPREGARVRTFVQGLLEREGIEMSRGSVERVQRTDAGIAAWVGDEVIQGDMMLVATGRRPNIQGLELEKASVRFSAKGIQTDRWLRTTAPHILAAGDVLGGAQFTHLAGWQCFQAVRNALLPGKAVGFPKAVPRVTFLEPEVASVGPTEEKAREELGQTVEVHEWALDQVDRAVAEAETEGFIRVLARRDGTIVGATIVAPRAGEMLTELVVAMENDLGLSNVANTVHAYPTWSTAVQQLAARASTDRFLGSWQGWLARKLAGL